MNSLSLSFRLCITTAVFPIEHTTVKKVQLPRAHKRDNKCYVYVYLYIRRLLACLLFTTVDSGVVMGSGECQERAGGGRKGSKKRVGRLMYTKRMPPIALRPEPNTPSPPRMRERLREKVKLRKAFIGYTRPLRHCSCLRRDKPGDHKNSGISCADERST
jgi:hypothetical protein